MVLWLVFAMMRKLFGIAIILALVGGAWLLWNNPGLLGQFGESLAVFFG